MVVQRRHLEDAPAPAVPDPGELEIAYLLIKNSFYFKVEYEKYKRQKGPDFTITDAKSGTIFNIEVKRIRKSESELFLEKWMENLEKQIRAIQSTLSFSYDLCELCDSQNFLDRLKNSTPYIINYISTKIKEAEKHLTVCEKLQFSIPNFENEIKCELEKLPKTNNPGYTSWSVKSYPFFDTQMEYKKFGDVICDSLRQLIPGMINVLAINTDSSTHTHLDFREALYRIQQLLNQKNDAFFINKKFNGKSDFLKLSRQLSGIFYRSVSVDTSKDRNILWCNKKADYQIPKDICKILKWMD